MKQMTINKASTEFFKNLRLEAEKNADAVERIKQMYDCFFAFGMIWSFGGALDEAKREFNGYLRGACSKLKFPEGGAVFDYYFDPIENAWL